MNSPWGCDFQKKRRSSPRGRETEQLTANENATAAAIETAMYNNFHRTTPQHSRQEAPATFKMRCGTASISWSHTPAHYIECLLRIRMVMAKLSRRGNFLVRPIVQLKSKHTKNENVLNDNQDSIFAPYPCPAPLPSAPSPG